MISPFVGVKNAILEAKNMRHNGWKVFSICAIALIPLIYAGLFLLAFLDPYGNLNNVPAAIVNEDSSYEVSGEMRNVGDELYDSLIENNKNKKEGEASGFDWQKTSREDAMEGLRDGKYYMCVIIPENFTENISSAQTSDPKTAQLETYFNPSTNLIASTVGSSMLTKIKSELENKVEKEYYDQIFISLTKANEQLIEAVDGSTQLDDGLESAKDGSNTITLNLATLSSGTASLEDGINQLLSGTSKLSGGAKTLKEGSETLQSSGTSSLSNGAEKLDAATNSKSEFASGATQLASGLKTLEKSTSTLPTSTKKLSSGIDTLISTITNSLGSATTKNTLIYGSSSVSDGTKKVNEALTNLSSNSTSLNSGSQSISSGITQLKVGSSTFNSAITNSKQAVSSDVDVTSKQRDYQTKLGSYVNAINTYGVSSSQAQTALANLNSSVSALTTTSSNAGIYNALNTVQSNYSSIDTAISALNTGYNGDGTLANPGLNSSISTYTGYVDTIASLTPTLYAGASQVDTGLKQMKATLTDKNGSATQLSSGAHQLSNSSPSLVSAITASKNGAISISGGITTLNSNIKTLSTGAKSVDNNMKKITSGASEIYSGTNQLLSGSKSASSGASQLSSGANALYLGSQTLTDGLITAKDGSEQLKDGLASGQAEMAQNTENSSQKVEVMSDPVTANGEAAQGENLTTVKNYGTGFAPYFIGLGMWVGCLMITFLLRSLNNRILMSRASSFAAVISSYLPMAAIALVQVITLLLTIQFGLNFNINFPLQYYAFGMLVALCFMAIIQLFRAWLGTPGMVVIIILLMLQLCTAAGTFPIEAEIDIFNYINPFLPMTYVVQGFRVAMCGLDPSYMTTSVIVLTCFLVESILLSTLVASKKRYATMTTLYPKIKMAE